MAATLIPAAALIAVGCGAGGGTKTALPSGPHTDAPPGNQILYVTMARTDRVEAYRLGNDGLLPEAPFSFIELVDNPRRLTLGDGILYVAMADRMVSLELGTDGSLPEEITASTDSVIGSDPHELLVRNGMLYVASAGFERMEAYKLDDDGHVPLAIDSAGRGESFSDYRTFDIAGDFLYAAASGSAIVDTFLLEPDGAIPLVAEDQEPETVVYRPDDLTIDSGVVYVTSGNDRAIHAYRIDEDGLLPFEEDSETRPNSFYAELLVAGDLLYASAFNAGRIDVYEITAADRMLVEQGPVTSTYADTAAFPNAFAVAENILYVAQAGLDRVDAYILDGNGFPSQFPSSSTRTVEGSFPTDVEIMVLP